MDDDNRHSLDLLLDELVAVIVGGYEPVPENDPLRRELDDLLKEFSFKMAVEKDQ